MHPVGFMILELSTMQLMHHERRYQTNILVNHDGNAVIADFGLSRPLYETPRTLTDVQQMGRLPFIAPELTESDMVVRTSKESDVYAFAMTIYHLLYGRAPFNTIQNTWGVLRAAQAGRRPSHYPLSPARLSSEWKEAEEKLWRLIQSMWNSSPSYRPTVPSVHAQVRHLSPSKHLLSTSI